MIFIILLLSVLPTLFGNPQYLCTSLKRIDFYNPITLPKQWVQTTFSETNYRCNPYHTYYYASCNETNIENMNVIPMDHSSRRFRRLSKQNRLRNQNIPSSPGQYQTFSFYLQENHSSLPIVSEILCIKHTIKRNDINEENQHVTEDDYDSKEVE